MTQRNIAIAAAILVVAAFLLGFMPEYLKVRELRGQLATVQRHAETDDLALSMGRVYLEASLKNYGLASQFSTQFFDRVRSMAGQDNNEPERQKFLQEALAQRDGVTSGLAKGDAAVLTNVQNLFQGALAVASNAPKL
ncbi:MAG: hypothetical protein ABI759_24315 [Candidatus Solibacter sp.]